MANSQNQIVLFLITRLMLYSCVEGVSYTAGVVEFSAEDLRPPLTPNQVILKNADRYATIISDAAVHGVDILVFPECGLTSINIPIVREQIPPYLTVIPEVAANPCMAKEVAEVIKRLSCAARRNRLYLVVNLDELVHCSPEESNCPSDRFLFYNTNVAFDREGTIVAKYRKVNLAIEPEFNTTKLPDHSWFDTDFGVKFGLFICYDILFYEPTTFLLKQNISNFVYSTAWFSELPYLSALSVQSAWSYKHDVNLLASGYSNATRGVVGSGIYAGRDGSLVAIYPEHSSTKLLISRLNADQRRLRPFPTEVITYNTDDNSTLTFFHANLENVTTVEVTNKTNKLIYLNAGFTCNVDVNMSKGGEGPKYKLVAYNGLRTIGLDSTYIELCGVIACNNASLSSCSQQMLFHSSGATLTNISITTTSSMKALLSFPITLGRNLLPLPNYTFQLNNKKHDNETNMRMSINNPTAFPISTFAIYRNLIYRLPVNFE